MYSVIHSSGSRVTISMRTSDVDFSDSRATKRRRKIRSCWACRRRKLHCDQILPACGRCVAAGQATDCVYLDDPQDNARPEIDSSSTRPSNASIERQQLHRTTPDVEVPKNLRAQEQRIADLENALQQMRQALRQSEQLGKQTSSTATNPPDSIVSAVATSNGGKADHKPSSDRQSILLKGKSFKTRFFGPTYPETAVAHIPKLSALSKEILKEYPNLIKLRRDLEAFKKRSSPAAPAHEDLVSLLPAKDEADKLVRLYLDKYESIYHIIHLPTFQRQYELMWTAELRETRTQFVALVILMTAMTRCSRFGEPWLYGANSSVERETSLSAADVCERWLDTQSQKKVTIMDFQVRFLINLVRIVNGSRVKRTWTSTGNLLRICMAAGLHIDMSTLGSSNLTSVLDQEMRRRIWYAVVELELQASLSRGMLSTPWPQQNDCATPLNLDDDDLKESDLSDPRPKSEFTTASYISIASETITLRHALNTALNDARQKISFEDARWFTQRIESHLRDIPHWETDRSAISRALLTITLHQYLLILHSHQYKRSGVQSEREYSGLLVVHNAQKIVQAHKLLSKEDRYIVQFLCPVAQQIALSICSIVTAANPQADSALSHFAVQSGSSITTEMVELVSERVYRLGSGQQQLWVVLVADALLKIEMHPDRKSIYMQEAADGMSRPYYKILACQDSVAVTRSKEPERVPTAVNGMTTASPDMLQQMASITPGTSHDPMTPHTPAVWGFEDWLFDEWTFDHVNV